MARKSKTFEAWLAKEHPKMKCIAMMYDEDNKKYEALLAQRVEVPANVKVEPEDEDKFEADPRKHLLLPGVN